MHIIKDEMVWWTTGAKCVIIIIKTCDFSKSLSSVLVLVVLPKEFQNIPALHILLHKLLTIDFRFC